MKRRSFHIVLLFLLLFTALYSCIRENDAFIPTTPNSILTDGNPIPADAHPLMEGVYAITSGGELFGPNAVLKWHGKDLSLFSETQGCYFVMNAVHLDSVIFLEGYWRYSSNNKTGLVILRISKSKGGKNILNKTPGAIIIQGTYSIGEALPSTELIMEYVRPFSQKVMDSKFYIMAHRSGGRNSDNLPFSENSIEMIRYTKAFGTTGIEIDIRLTKDRVPMIYHDEDLNTLLTTKGPLIGAVEDYTFDQISTYVRLLHGEKVPKLDDALTFVVDSTELKAVWLDMKDNPAAIKAVIPLQQKALARARQAGRTLDIWIGLPTNAMIEEFLAYPNYKNILALCELDPDDVRRTGAQVWSPRWTLGTQVDKVREMHSEGRKVFCWTIDDQNFMKKFIQEGEFDGLLSNYSAMTSYYFYMQE